jgi:putative ABC transport system ATP-binding protein
MEPILDIRNIVHTFYAGNHEQAVLRSLSMKLMPMEFVLLSGPSGCGKTTLLTLIGGLRSIQSGSIRLFGNELYRSDRASRNILRSKIGMIFQSHRLIGFLTAEENVLLAMDASSRDSKSLRSKQERARQLLSELGLGEKIYALPRQLSGGQRQRVAIARALACDPKLLIADEPTASLDAENGRSIMELLKKLVVERGLSILMTSHDQRVYRYADRIIRIDDGRLINS